MCMFSAVLAGAMLFGSSVHARVDPSSLQPQVGLGYQPQALDERGMWQDCARIEEEIATSNRRVRDAVLQAYVEGVIARLLGPQARNVRVYIMRDASFNAAMFSNGMTIINTGLLARARNEAELAAVLGHESAHYLLRHPLAGYRDAKIKSGVMAFVQAFSLVGAGVSAQTGGDPRGWIDLANSVNSTLVLAHVSFSRAQESEADAYGLKLMSDAGYEPDAAADIWRDLIAERKASAVVRDKRYRNGSRSAFSTHPPSDERFADLGISATEIRKAGPTRSWDPGNISWAKAIAPFEGSLIEEQVKLNDPGASLFLIETRAKAGWTATLRYLQGEVYRLRDAPGDAELAADAYAHAIQLPGAPAEAWRQQGYALIKVGQAQAGRDALRHYLDLKPAAPDAGMVRFALMS